MRVETRHYKVTEMDTGQWCVVDTVYGLQRIRDTAAQASRYIADRDKRESRQSNVSVVSVIDWRPKTDVGRTVVNAIVAAS